MGRTETCQGSGVPTLGTMSDADPSSADKPRLEGPDYGPTPDPGEPWPIRQGGFRRFVPA